MIRLNCKIRIDDIAKDEIKLDRSCAYTAAGRKEKRKPPIPFHTLIVAQATGSHGRVPKNHVTLGQQVAYSYL